MVTESEEEEEEEECTYTELVNNTSTFPIAH